MDYTGYYDLRIFIDYRKQTKNEENAWLYGLSAAARPNKKNCVVILYQLTSYSFHHRTVNT